MRRLSEAEGLTRLQRGKVAFQSHLKVNYERAAHDCRVCPTAGVCCTDAHFVNVHITRLEAVAIRETLARTPRLTDEARRTVYQRAHAAVARYSLDARGGDTYAQTFSCPLFEPGVGCLVHRRAKPAPCIQHACYDNWEDVPPAGLQWQAERRVEQLNREVYGEVWAWLPLPLWLALVDPETDGDALARLARAARDVQAQSPARRPLLERTTAAGGCESARSEMFSYRIGEREELRLPEARHAEELCAMVRENLERFREWMPGFPRDYAIGHAREFLGKELERFAERKAVPTCVWSDDRLAGFVSLKGIDPLNRNANLGYFIGAPFEGRGLVTRACRVLLDYAFDHLLLHRVEILCIPANRKSRAVPQRLGFTEEVTFREVQWLYDHFVDLVVYGMLEDEWRAKR